MSGLTINEVSGGFKEDTKYFCNAIYNNFPSIVSYPKLRHTKKDIDKLLRSNKMFCLLVYDANKRIAGYLLGEFVELTATNKIVFFISYLYVARTYRKRGIASKLVDIIFNKVKKLWNIDGIMLICDTDDTAVYDFYIKRGFTIDQTYKRNEKHDVLSIYV